jgi:hypothetical protein
MSDQVPADVCLREPPDLSFSFLDAVLAKIGYAEAACLRDNFGWMSLADGHKSNVFQIPLAATSGSSNPASDLSEPYL